MITIIAILLTSFFKSIAYETVRYSLTAVVFNIIVLGAFNNLDREPDSVFRCRLSVRCPAVLQLFLFVRTCRNKTPVYLVISASVLQAYSAFRILSIPFPDTFSLFNSTGFVFAVIAICIAAVIICFFDDFLFRRKDPSGYFCTESLKSYYLHNCTAQKLFRKGNAVSETKNEKRFNVIIIAVCIVLVAAIIAVFFVQKGIYLDYDKNRFILTKYYDSPDEAFTEHTYDAWRLTGPHIEEIDERQTVEIDELNSVYICLATDTDGNKITVIAPLYTAEKGYRVSDEPYVYHADEIGGDYVKLCRMVAGNGLYSDDYLYFILETDGGDGMKRLSFEKIVYYNYYIGSPDGG